MHFILVVFLVVNGRTYSQEPMYAVGYDNEAQCQAKADTYPKSGIEYKIAKCVPLFPNVENK